MKLFLAIIILVFALIPSHAKEMKEVVLLHSYHTGYQWTDDLTKGVLDGIGPGDETRVFVEYMDFKRFQNKDFFFELTNLYKIKYSKLNIDGIICADNYAFEFFLENGDSIWNKDIPVTACGVNNIQNFDYDKERIIGVREDIDVQNTISSLFSLQPNTDTLIIISDQTLSGKIFLSQFLDGLEEYGNKIPYEVLDGSNYDTIKGQLQSISPKNKAIVLLSLYSNKHQVPVEMKDIGVELLSDINIPVYSFWNFLFGDFIIGGSLISSYDQGYDAATIMMERIKDPKKKFPSLQETKHNLTFDYSLITKFNLDHNTLPNHTTFENKQIPFHIRFKKQLIYLFSTLIVLVIIIFMLMTNIIRRKSVEVQLIESEKRLELALNGANEGLWDIHFIKKNIFYNENFANLLGYQSSYDLNVNIQNWSKLFRSEDIQQIKEAFFLHLKGMTSIFKIEIQMYTKERSLHYFSINGKITERDINNRPTRITGIIMDISAQKEFETQLKIAKDKAEESDRLKSSFLANMSHEIRTPMNAILGFSDILMCQDLEKKEKNTYLAQIRNSGENLLHIINDIVDISKIESGQLMIRNEKFDLNQLLNNVEYAGLALIKAKKKSIYLDVKKKEHGDSQYIYTDPFRLEQVLLNLISNAVKFTHQGGIKLDYTLEKDNMFQFTVTDTGEGISPEDQLIIFERFRQAEKSSKKLLSGTGLGLSITQSLITMLGGDISVESEIDKGSCFTFTLLSRNV